MRALTEVDLLVLATVKQGLEGAAQVDPAFDITYMYVMPQNSTLQEELFIQLYSVAQLVEHLPSMQNVAG